MCGRYRLTLQGIEFHDHFDLLEDVQWEPRYNIAPTQAVATVRQEAKMPRRSFHSVRWGLVPYWAKDPSFGNKAINAVSETAATKPAFRDAMKRRRCLVLADGFYEWQKIGPKEKQPYNFGMADDSPFAFAGLWERWRPSADGQVLETCSILTTRSNALMSGVHDRMPCILRPEDYDQWLDPCITDPARVAGLLGPLDARLMRRYPVSARVSRVENDDPECAREITLTFAPTLF